MRKLIFDKSEWNKLKGICERGYPLEVCGFLFSFAENKQNAAAKVSLIEGLENILNEKHQKRYQELLKLNAVALPKERVLSSGRFEFVIDPLEHYEKVFQAEKRGLDQIGIFHSHPDHPAVPSLIDASQPLLAGWSTLIVAVHQGKFNQARSWFRETENSAFQEETILVE